MNFKEKQQSRNYFVFLCS